MRFILVFICIFIFACSEPTQKTVGLKSLDELVEIAKVIHSTGDAKLMLRYSDTSHIPSKKLKEITGLMEDWPGMRMRPTMKIKSIDILNPEEYDPKLFMPKEWSEKYKSKLKPRKWYIPPEKYILFTEMPKDPDGPEKNYVIRWTFGAFRKEGLWYFTTSYIE
jgi:hypothetical protein